jgi:hypothetical protein
MKMPPLPGGFSLNSEVGWRQASLPDVEGGISAARKRRCNAGDDRKFLVRRNSPPGWKPRLYGRQDACRYNSIGRV